MPTRTHLIVLVGDGDVGKSAIVYALAALFPEHYRIVQCDTTNPLRANKDPFIERAMYKFVDDAWVAAQEAKNAFAIITRRPSRVYAVRKTALAAATHLHHGVLHASPSALADFAALGVPMLVVKIRAADRTADPRAPERIAFDWAEAQVAHRVDAVVTNSFLYDTPESIAVLLHGIVSRSIA